MKVAQKVKRKVKNIEEGVSFNYLQLSIESNEYSAAAKAIERLIEKGIIKRISTGVFYKPKKTIFGELAPSEEELLKPYLFNKGKRIAYVTGISIYNRMGLTTQVASSIKIASRDKRITISVGNIKGTPVKSYIAVTDKNFYLLEILDALKDFKKIPDLDIKSGINMILRQLKKLKVAEMEQLITCALSYPPRVRALLGALLEALNLSTELKKLKSSLNPLSEYNYGIDKRVLSTITNWNIK